MSASACTRSMAGDISVSLSRVASAMRGCSFWQSATAVVVMHIGYDAYHLIIKFCLCVCLSLCVHVCVSICFVQCNSSSRHRMLNLLLLPLAMEVMNFYPRNAMLARYQLWSCVRLSVCLSVTHRCCIETAERIEFWRILHCILQKFG